MQMREIKLFRPYGRLWRSRALISSEVTSEASQSCYHLLGSRLDTRRNSIVFPVSWRNVATLQSASHVFFSLSGLDLFGVLRATFTILHEDILFFPIFQWHGPLSSGDEMIWYKYKHTGMSKLILQLSFH